MNCPKCKQLVEDGAAFCGNCGQALHAHAPAGNAGSHVARVLESHYQSEAPAYAISTPLQHLGETKAVLSLTLGIVGIAGALFVALVGLILGGAGLVLGTMAYATARRRLAILGIIFSSIAIIVSLGVWAYVVKHSSAQPKAAVNTTSSVAAATVATPCYATGFIDTLNVANSKNSCNMNAFNGPSLEASTKAYKVYANQVAALKADNFSDFAKKAVQQDIATSLPGFTVDNEAFGQFAGSPAYIAAASDKTSGVAVTEAVVLHQVQAGANVFVIVQAGTKGVVDLSTLEAQWQWR